MNLHLIPMGTKYPHSEEAKLEMQSLFWVATCRVLGQRGPRRWGKERALSGMGDTLRNMFFQDNVFKAEQSKDQIHCNQSSMQGIS